MNQSFYDISLVDGYNLPLAVVAHLNSSIVARPAANTTNPSCVASLQGLASTSFDPYNVSATEDFLGTTASQPLPFDTELTTADILKWCPSDLLQMQPSSKQEKTAFKPCLSACAKTNDAKYCCTGKHNSAKKCGPNYYSNAAKRVCPDAYSYAYDDGSSTFAVPTGTGFEVVFCPGGRSTLIQKTLGKVSAANGLIANVRYVVIAVFLGLVVVRPT